MNDKKIITVLGATGAQGGGLVKAILNDKNSEFKVRAITRKIDSEKAIQLARDGAEVVSADLDNVDSLKKAFENSYGVFGVTNFWEHYSPEKETQQAKNIAQAAKEAGVKHVIWSTLEDTRNWVPLNDNNMPTLMGKYKVPHFDGKGEADHFFTNYGVPTTFLLTTFYWDNLLYFGMGPKKNNEGKIIFSLPLGERKLAGIAVEDIGKCAYGIFKSGDKYINKKIGIAGGLLTGDQMANTLSKITGEKIEFNNIPFEVYRGLGFPGAEDLGNMFQFYHDFEDYFSGIRKTDEAKSLNSELQSFEMWATKNKEKIQLG